MVVVKSFARTMFINIGGNNLLVRSGNVSSWSGLTVFGKAARKSVSVKAVRVVSPTVMVVIANRMF